MITQTEVACNWTWQNAVFKSICDPAAELNESTLVQKRLLLLERTMFSWRTDKHLHSLQPTASSTSRHQDSFTIWCVWHHISHGVWMQRWVISVTCLSVKYKCVMWWHLFFLFWTLKQHLVTWQAADHMTCFNRLIDSWSLNRDALESDVWWSLWYLKTNWLLDDVGHTVVILLPGSSRWWRSPSQF